MVLSMIDRKIWMGDYLRLAEGNSFYGADVFHHRAGFAVVSQDSEVGEPLVEIDGGVYTVKREDLYELDEKQLRLARAIGTLRIPEALNGVGREEREALAAEARDLIRSGI